MFCSFLNPDSGEPIRVIEKVGMLQAENQIHVGFYIMLWLLLIVLIVFTVTIILFLACLKN